MRQANPDTSIVIGYSVDPVGTGLVASLARPGGNTTGLASAIDDIVEKQVELLIAAVPNLSRVAVLTNPANSFTSLVIKDIEAAAQKARLSLLPLQAQNLQDIENAFNAMTKERVGALVVVVDAFLFAHRQRIAELALKSRLPSMFGNREYAQAGGLMSYGDSLQEFYRHAASYVNKIFKGAKPEELPIEQPVKFNLVINRKTADTWADDSAAALHICRRGDRIEMQFAAVHESASGT
jgi:putative tryptophan/tyrosine transport system substrate-binding protein